MELNIAITLPFFSAFIFSILIAPGIIAALRRHKVGQTIQKDGPESHQSKAGTPTMGGIIIIIGMLIGTAVTFLTWSRVLPGDVRLYSAAELKSLVALIVLVIGYAAVGLVDDYLTIKPIKGVRGIASKPKAALQFLLAVGFVIWLRQTGFDPSVHLAGKQIFLGEFYWILAALFIAGMANFVNITDGLDGLVSGLTMIACSGLVGSILVMSLTDRPIAGAANAAVVAPLIIACVGACLAFLWFNMNPAKVFMGDTGSLAIGALLPAAAILMHMEILMMVIGLVFILDGFSTIIQWAVFKYTRITTGTGKRVFLKSPVHHHFEMMGIPEQTVVVRFWICGIIAAVLGFAGVTLGWW